jgi:Tfp pilus tip-associated adhesin PilY1
MKNYSKFFSLCVFVGCLFGTAAQAEDIDIFTGTTEVNTSLPNVIFVLDNTSNWSRQSQKWPGGLVQGQSEVKAIKTALAAQVGKLNVGIFEYVTGGSSADTDAGYTRFNLQELTATSVLALNATLDRIYNNINDPSEKRSSSNPYGDLPWDFYNYLNGGAHSNNGAGTPASLADQAAYTTNYSRFKSPLGSADACADTYMIFVGNNANGNIASDDTTNSNALKALYSSVGAAAPNALAGDSGTPLAMPEFACTSTPAPDIVITPEIPAYCEGGTEVIVPGDSFPAQPGKNLGTSGACYREDQVAACSAAEQLSAATCLATTGTTNCGCTTKASSHPGCKTTGKSSDRTYRWNVVGDVPAFKEPDTVTVVGGQCYPAVPAVIEPGGTNEVCATTGQQNTTGGTAYNFDDWTKFLHNYGIPLTVTVTDENGVDQTYSERVNVTTYVIDVFNKQQSAELSSVWFSAANAGGGRYFQAKSESQIIAAINAALGDILAVSSSFSAVSLPLSATNRARVDNQVYIGMFRPSLGKKPRWFGNLKRFQLALFNGVPRLADVKLHSAVNPADDSLVSCAESFWTEDNGAFWENLGVNPPPLREACFAADVNTSVWSDLPDGPFVEKGGVAQQTRQGPAAASRTIYTVQSDTALRALAAADATALGGTTVLDYLRGSAAGSDEVMPDSGLRGSIHGDVVHSRPLAVRHSVDDITLYYGANDGVFRAIDASDGSERWALVAPEHFGKIGRLYDNAPLIAYTGAAEPGSELKDYFFDGATGQLAIYDDNGALDLAYIFPTQRRGGRMVYALDVTDPDAEPDLLWRVGCPNLTNDTGCTTGFTEIGQTWSMPIGGYVEGYEDDQGDAKLVVVFGGGFDDCLNEDVAAYPSGCNSANGKGVYILDATTGQLLMHLDTDAPVVSELAPIDINFDGYMDFAYAADVAGNLYRVNFSTMNGSNPETGLTALAEDEWTIDKIASTADDERRFYNAPTVAAFQGVVVVTVGSGDRERPLEINYPYAEDVQNRFYAFFDEPYKTFVENPADPDDLEPGETTTVNLDGDTMLAVVAPSDGEDPEEFSQELDGWYFDLADRGEQVANPSAIGGGKVFFNTFQPGGVSNGLCTRPLGIGTGYAINLFGPEYTSGILIDGPGIPIPPVIVTVLIPPGLPPCEGSDCPQPPDDPCATGDCEVKTVAIGWTGFEPVEIVPEAPPIRRRIFFTESIDTGL